MTANLPLGISPDIRSITGLGSVRRERLRIANRLSNLAVQALITEAALTPKPALVDGRGPGAHRDLSLSLMQRSAETLRPYFKQIAVCASGRTSTKTLREELGAIGRRAEHAMFSATNGVNTHRGSIWSLGLLVAATAMGHRSASAIAAAAGKLALLPDRKSLLQDTNGVKVCRSYQVRGARGQAQAGFPQVVSVGLPMLNRSRTNGVSEANRHMDTLLAIMTTLDDTCLLHRGGLPALRAAQAGAVAVLAAGGTSTPAGWRRYLELDRDLVAINASPGGSADLLAATLFLDSLVFASASTDGKERVPFS